MHCVVDFVDVDSDKWRQYAEQKPWPLSWVYRREARCLLALEQALADKNSEARCAIQVIDLEPHLFLDRFVHLVPVNPDALDKPEQEHDDHDEGENQYALAHAGFYRQNRAGHHTGQAKGRPPFEGQQVAVMTEQLCDDGVGHSGIGLGSGQRVQAREQQCRCQHWPEQAIPHPFSAAEGSQVPAGHFVRLGQVHQAQQGGGDIRQFAACGVQGHPADGRI